ncbi:3-hydroxyacyl-CoA dehydrogenase NAD-binding domain-containing protein [Marinobacter adhaerens]|jgi:3-hydroxyacyl-CoA dehydrogenase|uniref:3-hydroxyacyl-CoA dehydrogenase NAD-binding domain-containing protein n=1 Tax=Marinobacter TaxID=2742 RepID=UPI001C603FEF|nr:MULTISPECIES: 3-hydroxyacyl-CoA dehydrogenase NAD-binding domain-containing protein [Marinobacter]MBW4979726.1 enoyl-CoA hydratase/isomerase family protein [Marinobacter adhaerens]MBY6073117.1 enoyl-CoA hydratase/isomerase family protein [Marinobacter salsuginis]MDC8456066.1 enoyl-CoA hydratase/isomerase family protein [Marinobacter sp. DS40M6]MDM8178999.1 3-hydroxyacyl-CoA dehydrogenase NAD-binding domain-containing protein [Marinobacter salarius]
MLVSYQQLDDLGIISIDNPPVNALSRGVREGICDAVKLAQDDGTKAIVVLCEGRTFSAGADINEFGKPMQEPTLPQVNAALESSAKPVIAAIHGSALGGGFELALSCHYRCALTSASVGLPEVTLGLLPGAGGTQRLPRLAGVKAALDIMTTGKKISATEARDLGVVDRVFDGDLARCAMEYARELITDGARPRQIRDLSIPKGSFDKDSFESYRGQLNKRKRGQEAPQKIVSCVEAAMEMPFKEGLAFERSRFMACVKSEQSAALRHIFFAERQAPKVPGIDKSATPRAVQRVGIIGAGTMGGGIAMSFASAGIPVTLLEISEDGLDRGLALIGKNYGMSVSKGKLSEAEATEREALISGTTSYQELANVDLVIEAVFESMAVKKQVFGRLDEVCRRGTILATNTSYLDVNEIAASTSRPRDVVGLHFFSPANLMRLLEVVRAENTADDVIATAMALGKRIGKVPVLAGVCFGFIGNRMLRQYAREAQLCLIEGAEPAQIDGVLTGFGMAMGPLAVGDLAGLDIGYKARQALTDEQKGDPKSYCIADALVELGRLGQKTGAGYYAYDPETRARSADPVVLEVIRAQAEKHGVRRCSLSDEKILNRHLMALINEGFRLLEEGIALRPGDIDVVYVNGYGFPAYRGGPMFYASQRGLEHILECIETLYADTGESHWAPAPLLKKLVSSNRTLDEWSS